MGESPAASPRYRLAIDDGKDVETFIKASFFSARELPQAVARLVLVREFWLGVGLPMVLLAVSPLLAGVWFPVVTLVALLWLVGTLASLSRVGRRRCIGCWLGDDLVGGLSLRVNPRRRRYLLEGAVVLPDHRKAGIFVALLASAFRIAGADEHNVLGLWAPAHPASRHIVKRYLDGHTRIAVSHRAFRDGLAALESQLPDDVEMLSSSARLG